MRRVSYIKQHPDFLRAKQTPQQRLLFPPVGWGKDRQGFQEFGSHSEVRLLDLSITEATAVYYLYLLHTPQLIRT